MKFPIYISDDDYDLENFHEEADMYKKPPKQGDDVAPSGFVMKLSGQGAGIKGQKAINVVIVKKAVPFVLKYRELKDLVFNDFGKKIVLVYLFFLLKSYTFRSKDAIFPKHYWRRPWSKC